MLFIVDESAGFAEADYILSVGHDVVAVGYLMPGADDTEILIRTAAEKRIIVTNDKDFGELIFRGGYPHYGAILLRLHDESTPNRLRVIASLLDNYSDALPNRFTVATERHVRFRPKLDTTP